MGELEKYTLNIKYSSDSTLLSCNCPGIMMRLCIVLNEYGYNIKSHNGFISVNDIMSIDEVQEIIDDQFNPDAIDIKIDDNGIE